MASSQEVHPEVLLLTISTAIGAGCTGIILLLSLISLWENRKDISLSRPVHRWRLPLLCTVFFSFTVFCLDGSTVWKHWSEGEGCEYVSILIPLCYVFEKQCLNLFLYDRAKIVHMGLAMEPRKAKLLKWLRWALWLTLVVGIPLCFYWSAFVAFAGKVLSDGECMFHATIPAIPIVFAVADSFLAMGMLIIFLVPLWEHQEEIKNAAMRTGNNSFKKMIRRNIRFSLLAIVSGVCGLSMLALFNWIYDGTAATEQFPTWGLFGISWDNLISTIAVHSMTPKWLPKILLKRFHLGTGSTINSNGVASVGPGNSSFGPMSKKVTRSNTIQEDPSMNSGDRSSTMVSSPAAYMQSSLPDAKDF